MQRPKYSNTRRRILIDMHIGDWELEFLAKYDPIETAEAVSAIEAEAAMVYFQSHLGLCYWPTKTGVQHAACKGRNFAGETVVALQKLGLPVCGYYSIGFNNEEYLRHQDWRIKPASAPTIGILPRQRYGIVCINNPEYREFVDAQVKEILTHELEAIFFDMVWWNGVCVCQSCQAKYLEETGKPIPNIVDWQDDNWLEFQKAREKWLSDFTIGLRDLAKSVQSKIEVYHNFALALSNWTRGMNFDSVKGHDFLGGDFYGDKSEQLFITRLMSNLSPKKPIEFMTTIAANLTEHNRLRTQSELERKVFASQMADAAFLGIIAIDPDGTIDVEALSRLKSAFIKSKAFEYHAVIEPLETVAIYFSDNSRMNINELPQEIKAAPSSSIPNYPHFMAASGVAKILAREHIPFGVISKSNLDQLEKWPVIILPNIAKFDESEIAAFKKYTHDGGKIYGSRNSLFGNEELFGVVSIGNEAGNVIYLKSNEIGAIKRPLSHWCKQDGTNGALRIETRQAKVKANLGLPYKYPNEGSAENKLFATIHSSPYYHDTTHPSVAQNRFGKGAAIYCVADIECLASPDNDALFVELLNKILPPRLIEINAHPALWLSAFEDKDRNLVLRIFNASNDTPPITIVGGKAKINLEGGQSIAGITRMSDSQDLSLRADGNSVEFEIGAIRDFEAFVIKFAP
ncbi:MAG: hypothetical protein FD163_2121 [Hyphomonadaceae bacterium]|nr:MAG: hypothetical protein FD163_2121 [Hyphomonadaceae bacterium]